MINWLISALWYFGKAPRWICWNPYNKVVQSHKDGTVYWMATDIARRSCGLQPFSLERISEPGEPPVHLNQDPIVAAIKKSRYGYDPH